MTDRAYALTVALERDIRVDDIQPLMDAIRQLRGVQSVAAEVVTPETWCAQQRARSELGAKLLDVVYPERSR